MRILHVDVSEERHLHMVRTCGPAEIVVHFAESGDEAISILVREPYDSIVIAPGLVDFDSIDLIRRLRVCRIKSPIVLLGTETTPEFRARALWDGADDVMDLPWDHEEMVARLKNLGRRSQGHETSMMKFGSVIIDQERMSISDSTTGEPIHVTEKEYLILELLALRRGRVCTKMQLMDHLYGGLNEPEEKIIDVFVCKLRRKLGQHGRMIETVWGRGYLMTAEPVSPAQAVAA